MPIKSKADVQDVCDRALNQLFNVREVMGEEEATEQAVTGLAASLLYLIIHSPMPVKDVEDLCRQTFDVVRRHAKCATNHR